MRQSKSCASGPLPLRSTSPPPSVRDMRILSKSLSHTRLESLGSTWSLRTVAYLNLCPWRTWSKSFGAAPPSLCGRSPYYAMPMCRWPPSTEKSQVLLCAATFKFRCHFIFLLSWSLAFSRYKNGPDRIPCLGQRYFILRYPSLCSGFCRAFQVSDSTDKPRTRYIKP